MKKSLFSIVVFCIGSFIIFFSSFLKERSDWIINWTESVYETCEYYEINCNFISSLLSELHSSGSEIKRGSISKKSLPTVRIYMDNGSVKKLDDKRNSVLAKIRPIHIAKDDDWVKAKIQIEYENKKEKSSVSLRLKGDWGDHLEDPKKLSFRVKTKAGGYLFGMKSFSIQHPRTRRYGNEKLILKQMRLNDILVPRYRFVDVFLNDLPIGVMAVEEHFRKEMIEAQNRRDGPILAVDEDPLWDQWDINYNDTSPNGGGQFNFSGHRDSMIKNFNGAKFTRGTIATNNTIRGQALLRDFYDGKISSRQAFDYEKLSKYWILVNIWGGCHSSIWHNRRFYFNPISGLLEPIGFDNIPTPEYYKLCIDVDIKTSLKDPQFLKQIALSAEIIYKNLKSPEFSKTLMDDQDHLFKLFKYEGFNDLPKKVTAELLINNLQSLLSEISKNYELYGDSTSSFMTQPPAIIGSKFLKEQNNISLHMSSFYYPGESGGNFEFRNLTLDPISISEIYIIEKKGDKILLDIKDFNVKSAINGSNLNKIPYIISDQYLAKYDEFRVSYIYKGIRYTRPIYVQLKNSPTGFPKDPIGVLRNIDGHKWIDIAGKKVVLAAGSHEFSQSISFLKGWALHIQAGAELSFRDGALLKLQGPLIVSGNKKLPVVFNIESDLSYMNMGSWGGLLVSKSPERSFIKHLKLVGNGIQNLNTRQGFYGMTGCLSFFESDVDISNSSFIDAQCEDALNIVKSDFFINNITITGARADAFDADFSKGFISNSLFKASGNDGIDVSGTSLFLDNINMVDIGDKAVSIGEKSNLEADTINIKGAVLGLVSKDLSNVITKNVVFEDISGTAIMTYIKKAEYGPSKLVCEDCIFMNKMSQTGAQAGTKITLNGKNILDGNLTSKQMIDSGLIEQGF